MMRKYLPWIGLALSAVIVGLVLRQCNKPLPAADVERVKAEAKTVIDAKNKAILERDLRIAEYDKKVDSLHAVIKELEADNVIINTTRDEKRNEAAAYTISEQQQFWADRYPE